MEILLLVLAVVVLLGGLAVVVANRKGDEGAGIDAAAKGAEALGMLEVPETDRPQVQTPDGGTRPIFVSRKGANSVDSLPAQPRNVAEEVWSDWVFALDAVFVANAKDGVGGEINVEQNLALGKILGALDGR